MKFKAVLKLNTKVKCINFGAAGGAHFPGGQLVTQMFEKKSFPSIILLERSRTLDIPEDSFEKSDL